MYLFVLLGREGERLKVEDLELWKEGIILKKNKKKARKRQKSHSKPCKQRPP